MRPALAVLSLAFAATTATAAPPHPALRLEDVARFYRVYDAAHGHPDAAALRHGYLDPGSAALHGFVATRIGGAGQLAAAIAARPAVYAGARRCAAALPAALARLPAVLERLAALDPAARFPPVTVVIGRDNSAGTTTAEGVVIGLETVCRADWMQPDPADRLVHLIAHEYAHVQQPAAQADPPPGASLLFQSLLEGGAELVAELTSGEISNVQLPRWTAGHECDIERRFAADAPGSDTRAWLYDGPGTADRPGDLGYWVGWRIARAYRANAPDRDRAVVDLLQVTDATAPDLLRRSGWTAATDCRLP